MSADIVDLDVARVAPYLMQEIELFLGDPPDTDFQRGYLAALVAMYREGLGRGTGDERVVVADRLWRSRP